MAGSRKRPARQVEQPDLNYIAEQLRPLAVPIESLVLDPKNCRKHGPKDIKATATSLREFGQNQLVVYDHKTRIVIVGNGRVLAAKENGWTHIAGLAAKLDPTKQRGYAIADNRTSELSEWDDDRLAAAIAELRNELPELAADLDLAALEKDLAAQAPSLPDEVDVPEGYGVFITLPTEAQQKQLFERLKADGYQCRLSNL